MSGSWLLGWQRWGFWSFRFARWHVRRLPQGGGVPGPGPDGNFPYQHVPLPKELPKGVSVKDAQRLQAIIDSYSRQDPLTVTKIRGNIYFAKGGPGNDPNMGFVVGKTSVIAVDSKGPVQI